MIYIKIFVLLVFTSLNTSVQDVIAKKEAPTILPTILNKLIGIGTTRD